MGTPEDATGIDGRAWSIGNEERPPAGCPGRHSAHGGRCGHFRAVIHPPRGTGGADPAKIVFLSMCTAAELRASYRWTERRRDGCSLASCSRFSPRAGGAHDRLLGV